MNIQDLLEVFGEVDADEILDHHRGDAAAKIHLKMAHEIVMLTQEGFLGEFRYDELKDACFDTYGEFIGYDWDNVVEAMRDSRTDKAASYFSEFDGDLISDLVFDENFCPTEPIKWEWEGIVSAYTEAARR